MSGPPGSPLEPAHHTVTRTAAGRPFEGAGLPSRIYCFESRRPGEDRTYVVRSTRSRAWDRATTLLSSSSRRLDGGKKEVDEANPRALTTAQTRKRVGVARIPGAPLLGILVPRSTCPSLPRTPAPVSPTVAAKRKGGKRRVGRSRSHRISQAGSTRQQPEAAPMPRGRFREHY